MAWTIEYFEQEDTTQPAEIFEDMLKSMNLSPEKEENNEQI